jgi:hypothetical protein
VNMVGRTSQAGRAGNAPQRRRLRWLGIAVAAVITAFAVATALLFVWPQSGMPGRVDALVMLGGNGNQYFVATQLAQEHKAPVLVISSDLDVPAGSSDCTPAIPGVKIICFHPAPQTTQGEAEYLGKLTRLYHWHSIAVVTIAPQDTRVRLRFGRCISPATKLYLVNGSFQRRTWPYEIAYEWAATVKALVLQRSC